MGKDWTHKVVKESRGMDGKFFSFPAAATFDSFEEAVQYAREFHAKQYAILGRNDGHIYSVYARAPTRDTRHASFYLSRSPEHYADDPTAGLWD